jgi:hypothetical protein
MAHYSRTAMTSIMARVTNKLQNASHHIMGIGEITKFPLLLLTETTSHLSWNLKILDHQ